jgi:hypothetical protein
MGGLARDSGNRKTLGTTAMPQAISLANPAPDLQHLSVPDFASSQNDALLKRKRRNVTHVKD